MSYQLRKSQAGVSAGAPDKRDGASCLRPGIKRAVLSCPRGHQGSSGSSCSKGTSSCCSHQKCSYSPLIYYTVCCQVEVGCQGTYSDFPSVPGRAEPVGKAKPHPALYVITAPSISGCSSMPTEGAELWVGARGTQPWQCHMCWQQLW